MTAVAVRVAGPLQSWGGYRLQVNKEAVVPTAAMPRKSGINGLIGAAIGSRDLDEIGSRYDLLVRIDATNPVVEDYQTLNALPGFRTAKERGRATELVDRAERIRTAGDRKQIEAKRDGGNVVSGSYTSISRKDYLPHSEFILALDTSPDTAKEWMAALRAPRFMTCLGRKSCPPTFPFLLGIWTGDATDLVATLPHHDGYGHDHALRVHRVTGDYDHHETTSVAQVRPAAGTREEQLAWCIRHLNR